jgi:hypothetical protein
MFTIIREDLVDEYTIGTKTTNGVDILSKHDIFHK